MVHSAEPVLNRIGFLYLQKKKHFYEARGKKLASFGSCPLRLWYHCLLEWALKCMQSITKVKLSRSCGGHSANSVFVFGKHRCGW